MRMLSCLIVIAFSASPALAAETGGKPVFDPGAEFNRLVASLVRPVGPVAKPQGHKLRQARASQPAAPARAGACPKCGTAEMPSFAIRSADENRETTSTSAAPMTFSATDTPGVSASQPPINFSFSGSADGSRSNKYNGGVRVGTSF